MKFLKVQLVAAAALAMSATAFASSGDANGAGASFPANVYKKWATDYYKATGNKINYESVGSSAGTKQIIANTVDFGGSDTIMKQSDLDKNGLMQFPTVIGGVVPVVNIAGIKAGDLKLTGPVLAEIYAGVITKWNDPKITATNAGLKLPDATIRVVRRSDGSGTTFVFTDYLAQVSPMFKDKIGVNKAPKWPVGVGAPKNTGVAKTVGAKSNSIGYVGYDYAKQNKLTHVLLQNKEGNFVAPSEEGFQAAAEGTDWSKGFGQSLNNQPGAKAWPISTTTFILVHKKQTDAAKGAAVLKFFDWAYKNGDAGASALDFVAFPASVKERVRKSWAAEIKDASGKPIKY